eukprot:TRINITY_DN25151_c0_g2_i1.p1 TRINITY_DN25151_c0_g2~~TRINITY_DN25151_c0_g2_i1.p1  ORF type:complete len:5318 (+),score=1231.96 TRINITY_DN25151_c0_g2_i1:61-15954(+)
MPPLARPRPSGAAAAAGEPPPAHPPPPPHGPGRPGSPRRKLPAPPPRPPRPRRPGCPAAGEGHGRAARFGCRRRRTREALAALLGLVPCGSGTASPAEYGTRNKPVVAGFSPFPHVADLAGASADLGTEHALLLYNGTLLPRSFVAGQEVRVRVTLSWKDLTGPVGVNDSAFDYTNSSEVVCANGTSIMPLWVSSRSPGTGAMEAWLLEQLRANLGSVQVYDWALYNETAGSSDTPGGVFDRGVGRRALDSLGWVVHWGACWRPECCGLHTEVISEVLRMDSPAAARRLLFNTSAGSGLELAVWPYLPGASCANPDGVPAANATARVNSMYWMTEDMGVSLWDYYTGTQEAVAAAHSTFVAPDFPFFICFRRSSEFARKGVNQSSGEAWLPLAGMDGDVVYAPDGRGANATLLYEAPEGGPVGTGQYFAVKIYNHGWEGGNVAGGLSLPPSSAWWRGDNAKLVPRGAPCTYESAEHPYYGSSYVDALGDWREDPEGAPHPGLLEGSTPGGVGRLGLESLNPVVGDTFDAMRGDALGVYRLPNGTAQWLVAFLRAPEQPGDYELCLSLRQERAEWRLAEEENTTQVPMWRKPQRCPTANDTGNPQCHPSRDAWATTFGVGDYSNLQPFEYPGRFFTVVAESWGWSTIDLTPGTWGWLRVDSAERAAGITLGRAAEHQAGGMRSYYRAAGGDQLRLVRTESFAAEDAAATGDHWGERPLVAIPRSLQWHEGDAGLSQELPADRRFDQVIELRSEAPSGSLPGAGCWDDSADAYAEFGSVSPSATIHMQPDPTVPGEGGAFPWYAAGWQDAPGEGAGYSVGLLEGAVSVGLSASSVTGAVRITLSFPAEGSAAVGFGQDRQQGEDGYQILVLPPQDGGGVSERVCCQNQQDTGVALGVQMLTVLQDSTQGVTRTVVLSRALQGVSALHHTFGPLEPRVRVLRTTDPAGFFTAAPEDMIMGVHHHSAANRTSEGFAAVRFPELGSEWEVCYRPAGAMGWRRLRFRGTEDPLLPAKWRRFSRPDYPYGNLLVPQETRPPAANVSASWEINGTREHTWAQLVVRAAPGDGEGDEGGVLAFNTLPNDVLRDYSGGPSDRVAGSIGWALRLVPISAPCAGLQAAGVVGEGAVWAESLDAGLPECPLGELLRGGSAHDCRGAAHSTKDPRPDIAFWLRIPRSPLGRFRVCLRHGAMNWAELHSAGGGAALHTAPPPRLSVIHADALVAGSEGMVLFRDEGGAISARNDSAGDWAWLVPEDRHCAPTLPLRRRVPLHNSTAAPWAAFIPSLADGWLQAWCPRAEGRGGVAPESPDCASDAVVAQWLCGGSAGSGGCGTRLGLEYRAALASAATPLPAHLWGALVPHGGVVSDGLDHAAAVFAAPASPAESGSRTTRRPRLRVCYRIAAEGLWVDFGDFGGGLLAPPPAEVGRSGDEWAVEAPAPGAALPGGALQRFALGGPKDLLLRDPVPVKLVRLARPPGYSAGSGRDPLPISDSLGVSAARAALLDGRVQLRIEVNHTGIARVTVTGPSTSWFAVGFGGLTMKDTYAIIVHTRSQGGTVEERVLGHHAAGEVLTPQALSVIYDTTTAGRRTVVMERPVIGATPLHHTFRFAARLGVIAAVGYTDAYSYHGISNYASEHVALVHGAPRTFRGAVALSAFTGDAVGATVELRRAADVVRITLTGSASVWFGFAFGAQGGRMEGAYAIICRPPQGGFAAGTVEERHLGDQQPGVALPNSLLVLSDTTDRGARTVVVERTAQGATADHYSFVPGVSVGYLSAAGLSADFAYHGKANRKAGTFAMSGLPPPEATEPDEVVAVSHCGDPPGSTEASPFASGALAHPGSQPQTDPDRASLRFDLVVPQLPGRYALCLANNGSAGWRRAATYEVRDNGIRWAVRPPAGRAADSVAVDRTNVPTNQGALSLTVTRCGPDGAGGCATADAVGVLDRSPGGAAVKVLPSVRNIAAGAGSPEAEPVAEGNGSTTPLDPSLPTACGGPEPALGYGGALHSGVEPASHPQWGVHDLGPDDRPGREATAAVTLPPVPGDAAVSYKVCVWAAPAGGGAERWLEVSELRDPARTEYSALGADHLRSEPAAVGRWTAEGALSPLRPAEPALGQPQPPQLLAGASSSTVSPGDGASAVVWAFLPAVEGGDRDLRFELGANESEFKLVAARRRTAAGWQRPAPATCLDPAAVRGPLLEPERGRGPAGLELPLFGVGAHDAVEFLVCLRRAPGSAWVQQLHAATGAATAVVVPSWLSFITAPAAPAAGGGVAVTVLDTASDAGGANASASWCGGAANCSANAPGLRSDLLFVANGTDPCPSPTPAADGSVAPGWVELRALSNISSAPAPANYTLRPEHASPSGTYSLCLWKGAEHAGAGPPSARSGVVYQLWNLGAAAEGGGTAHWVPAQPDALAVRIGGGRQWDPDRELLLCPLAGSCRAPDLPVAYPGGFASRSVVLGRAEVLELSVQSATKGAADSVGELTVWAEWCAGQDDPGCAAVTEDPPYLVENTLASGTGAGFAGCSAADSPAWGLHESATTQPMQGGLARYRLRLLSACPNTAARLGCGLRFAARTAGGRTLRSPPVWVNVQPDVPRGVRVREHHLSAGPSARRQVGVHCWAFAECDCSFAAAAQGGEAEAAPSGRWNMTVDMPRDRLSGLAAEWPPRNWPLGGAVPLLWTPVLAPGAEGAEAVFTVQSTGGVVQWAVSVQRRAVERVAVESIVPVWIDGQSVPQPAWERAGGWDPPASDSVAPAADGAHVTALHPYELRVRVYAGGAPVPAAALLGLRAEVYAADAAGDAGGAGLPRLAAMPPGEPSAELLALTADAYLPPLQPVTLAVGDVAEDRHGGIASLRFRVVSPLGCSRFAPDGSPLPPGEAGCSLCVRINGTVARAVTPVRGLADSLLVEPVSGWVDPSSGPPTATVTQVPQGQAAGHATQTACLNCTATATLPALFGASSHERFETGRRQLDYAPRYHVPIRPGLRVWVQPRSLRGGFADEFHYASVVVLFHDAVDGSEGGGREGPFGVRLLRNEWEFGHHPGRGWGALVSLEPTTGCVYCSFTFHSTGGAAGGVQYEVDYQGSVLPAGGVLEGVRFYDPTQALSCAQLAPAPLYGASSVTEPFDVAVAAVTAAGERAGWQDYWVYIASALEVVRVDTGERAEGIFVESAGGNGSGGLVAARMRRGEATLRGLRLREEPQGAEATGNGSAAAGLRGGAQLGVRVRARNDELMIFERLAAPYEPCIAAVLLDTAAPRPAPERAVAHVRRITAGAASLVSVPGSPDPWPSGIHWEAGSGPLSFEVGFSYLGNRSRADHTDRNITYYPEGWTGVVAAEWEQGGSTFPTQLTSSARWPLSGTPSFRAEYPPHAEYTYGTAKMLFRRRLDERGLSAPGGVGEVTLTHTVPSLCRDCRVRVCAVRGGGPVARTELAPDLAEPCVTVRLFIAPQRHTPLELGVSAARLETVGAASGQLHGGQSLAPCGAEEPHEARITLFTWVEYEGARYPAYELPATFQLSQGTQVLWDQNGDLGPAAVLTLSDDTTAAGVQYAWDPSRYLNASLHPTATFAVRGLMWPRPPAPFHCTATARGHSAEWVSSAAYSTAVPPDPEPPALFEVQPAAGGDPDCVSRSRAPAWREGYEVWEKDPGRGLSYAAGPEGGPVAGVPFPITARVASATGRRSYGSARAAVRARLRSAHACGDGGQLGVLRLREPLPQSRAPVYADGPAAYVDAGASGVPTTAGVAPLWVNFSQPCQSCVLELTLCATADLSAAGCWEGLDSLPAPPIGARTAVTLPFSVHPLVADAVAVTAQRLPNDRAPHGRAGDAGTVTHPVLTVAAGDEFAVSLRPVRRQAPAPETPGLPLWHHGAPADRVAVGISVRWAPAAGQALRGAAMRYAYGGWLSGRWSSVDIPHPCHYSDRAKGPPGGAEEWQEIWTAAAGTPRELLFHFTRPCESCSVALRAQLRSADGAWRGIAFPLRGPDGSLLVVNARACGHRWALAPPRLHAAFRRRPFAVVLWRTDALGFPSWGFSQSEAPENDTVVLSSDVMEGNGGGGALRHTNIPEGGTPLTVRARGGVAIARLQYTRACQRCVVSAAGSSVSLPVLTPAARITAVLPEDAGRPREWVANGSREFNFTLGLFAADDVGDRAYTAAGPTPLLWRPAYSGLQRAEPLRVMPLPGLASRCLVTLPSGSTATGVCWQHRSTVAIAGSPLLVNGAPWDGSSSGSVTVTLSGHPGSDVELLFVTGTGTMAQAAERALPTWLPDQPEPPAIHAAPRPEVLVVVQPESARPEPVAHHRWLEIRLFAAAPDPTHPTEAHWYRAATAEGTVHAEANCPGFGAEGLGQVNAASLADGEATLRVRFYDGAGQCRLSFVHLVPNGTAWIGGPYRPGVLDVVARPPEVVQFKWVPSGTVDVDASAVTDGESQYNWGFAVAGRRVSVALAAADAEGVVDKYYRYDAATNVRVHASPAGCFQFEEGGAPAPGSGVLHFHGVFADVRDATAPCRFLGATLLPGATTLASALYVVVQLPHHLVAVPQGVLGETNFTGVSAITEEGVPAVVAGKVFGMAVAVVDAEGKLLRGDFGATVTARPVWSVEEGGTAPPFSLPNRTAPLTAGRADFNWTPSGHTRAETAHTTLRFAVALAAPAPEVGPYGAFSAELSMGPVAVVIRGSRLLVALRPAGAPRELAVRSGEHISWVAGLPFSIRATVGDDQEPPAFPSHPDEDYGAEGGLSFTPIRVPCTDADAAIFASSCVDLPGASCRLEQPPRCRLAGWVVPSGLQEHPLRNASAELPGMRWCGSCGGGVEPVRLDGHFPLYDIGYLLGAPVLLPGVRPFYLTFRIQDVQGVNLTGVGVSCRDELPGSGGAALRRCGLDATYFQRRPPSGWRAKEGRLLPGEEQELRHRVWVTEPGDDVPTTFAITAALVDGNGAPVLAGGGVMRLRVSARCVAADPRYGANYSADPGLALWDAARGAPCPPRAAGCGDWDVANSSGGVATWTDLVFTRTCPEVELRVSCEAPAELDPDEVCNGRVAASEVVDAELRAVEVASPVPARDLRWPAVTIVIGSRAESFAELWADLRNGSDTSPAERLQGLLHGALAGRSVCRNNSLQPATRSGTAWLRTLPSCPPRSDGHDYCLCREIGLPGLRMEDVSVEWVCLASTTEAQSGGIHPNWKGWRDRCQPLRSNMTAARKAVVLQDSAAAWMVEFVVEHGPPSDPQAAAALVAQIEEALQDTGTSMYKALDMPRALLITAGGSFLRGVEYPALPPVGATETMTVAGTAVEVLLSAAPRAAGPAAAAAAAVALAAWGCC